MNFQQILATLPSVDHIKQINVLDKQHCIHHIPVMAGKLGSLRVYHTLAQQFNGKLDRTSAQQGLTLFAEHVEDAKQNPTKHPNIDLLLHIIEQNLSYTLEIELA